LSLDVEAVDGWGKGDKWQELLKVSGCLVSSTYLLLIVLVLTRGVLVLGADLPPLLAAALTSLSGQLAKFPGLVFPVGILMAIVVDMICVDGM
jgi:hypothetical protein